MSDCNNNNFMEGLVYINIVLTVFTLTSNAINLYKTHQLKNFKMPNCVKENVKTGIVSLSNLKFDENEIVNININSTPQNKKTIILDRIDIELENNDEQV